MEWVYFLHPPRQDLAATMTAEEGAAWERHFQWLEDLLSDGRLVLAGPTLGPVNTGVAIFEAPDEQAARAIVSDDPAAARGYARGELRGFDIGLMRGR
jgi:uncharacterized protein YciI